MGRVVGPWGVRGWVKVAPYGERPDGLVDQRTWWLRRGEGPWQAHAVAEARMHSGTIVAALEGYGNPESAAGLKGFEVAVPRSALPRLRKDEVYLADLVGLEVVSVSGAVLGTVVAMEDYGAHPVMRVREAAEATARADRLVPCVAPILRSVDLAGRRIEVEWEPEY
jgi:16S rRNA processing protein RimM